MKQIIVHKKKLIIAIALAFLLVLLTLVGLFIIFNRNDGGEVEYPALSMPVDDVSVDSNLILNLVFYTKYNNIYSFDLEKGQETKLTYYEDSDNTAGKIKNLQVIDTKKLGFGMCDTVAGDFGCSINTLDIETRIVEEKILLSKDELLVDLGFNTSDKFAYLYTTKSQSDLEEPNVWILRLFSNNSSKVLSQVKFSAFGRGYNPLDSQKISFSKNGRYLLQISTESPISTFDANTYIHDLEDGSTRVISHSTQPAWLSNEEVIYKSYDPDKNISNSLQIYNIRSNMSLKLDNLSNTAGTPQVLGNNAIVYSDLKDLSVGIYNLDSGDTQNLLNSVVDVTLLLDEYIFYSEAVDCDNKPDCGGLYGDYERGGSYAYNITSQETISLGISLSGIDNLTSF